MKRASLLRIWPQVRQSVAAWTVFADDQAADDQIIRAVAETIVHPTNVGELVKKLLDAGEFEAAELALIDDDMLAGLSAERRDVLEGQVQKAKTDYMAASMTRFSELQQRSNRCQRPIAGGLVSQLGKRRVLDERAFTNLESSIREHEREYARQLHVRLEELSGRGPNHESWRAMVEQALDREAFDVARAALDRGPIDDFSDGVDVPSPPVWGYRKEPLNRVVGWFFEQGPIPPGFESNLPKPDDRPAWALLRALRDIAPAPELLTCVAEVIGCRLLGIERRHGGYIAFLAGLGADGFHAFGETRMPAGIPLWLPEDPQAPDLDIDDGSYFIRLVIERLVHRTGTMLYLSIDDLLAVLHDERRRERIAVQLGRQLPLRLAFGDRVVDRSTRWPNPNLPDLINAERTPTLLLGAPGMGKTTLLEDLASKACVTVHDVSTGAEFPQLPVILIDGVEASGPTIRALVRDIHWARTTAQPTPVVVVAARPEARSLFEEYSPSMFEIVELRPRSHASLREQAAAMLAWVGIDAEEPGSYDRMALLACGNPTVLYHLCSALANTLASASRGHRRFSPTDLEQAWESAGFRSAVRSLLWGPLSMQGGIVAILRALVEFCEPGARISRGELAWVLDETTEVTRTSELSRHLTTLSLYGLTDEDGTGIRLAIGGPELLVRNWLSS